MMYENRDPFRMREPGGTLDATHARYTALDPRSSASRWRSSSAMTIDAFFATAADFHRAAASKLTDPLMISGLYGVPADTVQVFLLDQLNAIKISVPRPVVQGAVNDADLHAGRQYVPLLPIEIPPEVRA